MKKKRAFTLLEIMIVIFLIGLIGSIIGYNMKGSLDKGKAFKTQQSIEKIQDILELEIAKGVVVTNEPQAISNALENSGIVKNPKKLMKDGWGQFLNVEIEADGAVTVTSEALDAYKEKIKSAGGKVDFFDDDENEEEF
ncbi:MAG: Type II secretion system protein G [Chlamydiae bacterium]|nr:Type II secretion system protein G [Chlamydiota bacterium]